MDLTDEFHSLAWSVWTNAGYNPRQLDVNTGAIVCPSAFGNCSVAFSKVPEACRNTLANSTTVGLTFRQIFTACSIPFSFTCALFLGPSAT